MRGVKIVKVILTQLEKKQKKIQKPQRTKGKCVYPFPCKQGRCEQTNKGLPLSQLFRSPIPPQQVLINKKNWDKKPGREKAHKQQADVLSWTTSPRF